MIDIISKIETIKYSVFKKEQQVNKIRELEELLENPFVDQDDIKIIKNRILELQNEASNDLVRGINKLKQFRLNSNKTSHIDDEVQFIYPNLIEVGKTIMFFGESGIGKTLFILAFANYALINKNIKSVISLDFDNGLKSLKNVNMMSLLKNGEKVYLII